MDRNFNYAKKLSEIGDKIIKISNKFSNVNLEKANIEGLKRRHDNYLNAINEYKQCKTSLNNIVPPSKVRIEHEKMVDAIELFVEGTEAMFNSINIDNCSVDKESMDKGILMEKLGEKAVVKLSDEIATKLIGSNEKADTVIDENLEKFANIARSMTGSNISTSELFETINYMDDITKEKIYLKVNSVMKQNDLPFDKAFPLVKKEFIRIANEFKIDPAVLFQVYIIKFNR